jgi:hypothetical protein
MIIKKYNNFITDKIVEKKTIQFINDEISESEFITFLQQEIVNESIIDVVKNKIINVLSSFLNKAKEIGFKIFEKLKSILNWIIDKINTFKQKNPIFYKVLTITIIIVVILIISTSTAHAATTGQPIPVDKIDMAIGLLRKLSIEESINMFDASKAIAYLVDLRDGTIELPEIGQRSVDMANAALKTVDTIGNQASSKNDTVLMDSCLSLMERGREVLSAVVEKIGSTEKVKLIFK